MAPARLRVRARAGGAPLPERRPSIFVVGPEGSGTTVLWRCLAAHPELRGMTAKEAPTPGKPFPPTGLLLHLSLPTLRPMRWVDPDELPRGATVVTVRRSAVHTVYSAYRRFHRHPAAAWRAYLRAVELEARYVAERDPICVCYEDLASNSAKVLRGVYEAIGVRGDFHPPVELRNRNDRRWRADVSFRTFMRTAFGSIDGRDAAARAVASSVPRRGDYRGRNRPPGEPAAARYVCIHDVLAPSELARIVGQPRRGGRAEVWRALEDRLRQFFPYVRRELRLPWLPLQKIERRASVGGDAAASKRRARPDARRRITCIYSFDGDRRGRGGLRLYPAGAASRAPVSIDPADNTAVFFVGDAYRQKRGRRTAGADRGSVTVSLWLGRKPQNLDSAMSPRSKGPSTGDSPDSYLAKTEP